ncbi:MAG: competence/damage-inducible protein A [Balneolaceae bacterium]|nr:competence/damage-inducible protein A [Balneolaceae bacterium]
MRMKRAHIISIGNELLIGDTINTNAAFIGQTLTHLGVAIEQVFTIPDDYSLIKRRISSSLEHADVTIVTGGLGPTHDDITKKVVSEIFGSKLVQNERVLNHIKKIFFDRGFTLSPSNIEQAAVPDVCDVLYNEQGTAPGMWFEKENHYLAVLPGVPYEMKYLMEKRVIPKLKSLYTDLNIRVTDYLKTAGIPESTLSDLIGNLEEYTNNGVGVAYLPNPGGVTIRLSADGTTAEQAEKKLLKLRKMVYKKSGDFIFAKQRDKNLAEVVGAILSEKKLTLAVAESCTGGMLANELTNITGSSAYMLGGVVAYSNSAKSAMLSVDAELINQFGAVSKPVALEMAKNAAQKFGADIGISTTGIAGPGGGTAEKPVGTVWIGFYLEGENFALKTVFTNNRLVNKQRTVMVALETVRRRLLGIKTYPYELKPHFS